MVPGNAGLPTSILNKMIPNAQISIANVCFCCWITSGDRYDGVPTNVSLFYIAIFLISLSSE
jgi:hypothetical protein